MNMTLYRRSGVPSLFRDVFGEDFFSPRVTREGDYCWAPAVDIFEVDDQLKFEFELPGVAKKDINLEYKDGVLTLQGTKVGEKEEKQGNYFARERCTGSFSRGFRIGEAYDPRAVTAVFKDGILTVSVAKREESKPVAISVQ